MLKSYNQTSAFIQDTKLQPVTRSLRPGILNAKGTGSRSFKSHIHETVASGRRQFSCFQLISEYKKLQQYNI